MNALSTRSLSRPPCSAAAWVAALLLLAAAASTGAQVPASSSSACPVAPPAGTSAQAPQQVSAFVHDITQSTRFDRQSVARWHVPLCFDVQGLPENETGFVAARLSQVARCAGAQVRSAGCSEDRANFRVVFSLNADQAAKDEYARHRRMFDRGASRAQIERFLDPPSPAAVRVWHDAMPIGKDGFPLIPIDPTSPVEPMAYQNFQYDGGSRLTAEAIPGLSFTLIIIDGTRAGGASLGQLADYAAMVGLADLGFGANVGEVPTILRLFSASGPAQPAGLTPWDQAFLGALYHADQSASNLRTQIAGAMVRNLTP